MAGYRLSVGLQVTLVACVYFCCSSSASAQVPGGLVSWWKAEEDILDSVGANHGTASSGAGFVASVPGRGQAFRFRGNGYVDLPSMQFGPAFSFAAYVNPAVTSGSGADTIIGSCDDPDATSAGNHCTGVDYQAMVLDLRSSGRTVSYTHLTLPTICSV